MLKQFETKEFTFQGRDAKILYPSCPSNGKLILKTEYFDAFPTFEVAMLKKGYTLCFLTHPTRWAPDSETHVTAEFVRYVAAELNMEPKCIIVGMSCGGLQGLRLAELYPELVSVLFLDAPVTNLLSLAGLGECTNKAVPIFWKEMVDTFGFTQSTILTYRKSPIDNMKPLIENNIPIIMVYGDADDVVLYRENGQILEDYYKEHNGDISIIRVPGRGHHPHGLADPTPIIEYVEAHL